MFCYSVILLFICLSTTGLYPTVERHWHCTGNQSKVPTLKEHSVLLSELWTQSSKSCLFLFPCETLLNFRLVWPNFKSILWEHSRHLKSMPTHHKRKPRVKCALSMKENNSLTLSFFPSGNKNLNIWTKFWIICRKIYWGVPLCTSACYKNSL